MYGIERKSHIIEALESDGNVYVASLAKKFNVSCETIRRDLRELECEGILKRTHGGAVVVKQKRDTTQEYPVLIRGIQHREEKDIICQYAAQFIEDGDTLFLDNSSTALGLLKFINPDMSVTIITNSLQFIIESTKFEHNNFQIICLGGQFRRSNYSVHGFFSLDNAKEFFPNKVFISCHGIDQENIVTDGSMYEVGLKRFMIERGKQVFLLADHTKFEKRGAVYLSDCSMMDYVITDVLPNDTIFEQFSGLSTKLVSVDRL